MVAIKVENKGREPVLGTSDTESGCALGSGIRCKRPSFG